MHSSLPRRMLCWWPLAIQPGAVARASFRGCKANSMSFPSFYLKFGIFYTFKYTPCIFVFLKNFWKITTFSILWIFPQDSQIKRIFSTMLSHKLQDFEEDLKLLSEAFTVGSIEFHKAISAKLLPVPAKIHYTFNMKDISRVAIILLYLTYLTFGLIINIFNYK